LELQSWSFGVQLECSSGIYECDLSAVLVFGSEI